MVKENCKGRVALEKSCYEHTDVSYSIEIVFTTVFLFERPCVVSASWRIPLSYLFFLSLEAFGLLVLLSFDISAFTPAAYQRHRL